MTTRALIRAALAAALLLLAWAPAALAHDIWINTGPRPAQVGQALPVSLGFGHHFPASEKCDPAKLEPMRTLGPDGKAAPLTPAGELAWTLTPAAPGSYLLLAGHKAGFLTKTTQGYRNQDKKGLKEVLWCFRHDLRGKGLVGSGTGWDQRVDDPLELIPQADPSTLKPGGELPVLVLFKGQPLAGAELKAIYAGFKSQDHKPAWQGKSDAQGLAKVPLTAPGPQLISVSHKIPFPQPEKCDHLLYKYTLTFNLR